MCIFCTFEYAIMQNNLKCKFMVVTREMFLEALKQMKDASAVIEAYQMQFSDEEKPKSGKSLENVKEGDFVKCVFVHSASTKHLTKGKEYEVLVVREDHNFMIKTDSGKRKSYYLTNSHFKVV